jgi:DNA-binding transcriptional ArsR family regulator
VVDPRIVGAFAQPTRLAILVHCEGRPRAAAEIAEELQLTRSAARWHFGVLQRARLLHAGPRGYVSGIGWAHLRDELEDIARRHAELSA